MKRDAVVKRLLRYLNNNRGCSMTYSMASDVLGVVEKCYLPLYNEWDHYNMKKMPETKCPYCGNKKTVAKMNSQVCRKCGKCWPVRR